MRQKRICIITTTSETINCFLLGQLQFLSCNGYDVTVVCNDDPLLDKKLPSHINYSPVRMKRGVQGMASFIVIYNLYRIFKKGHFDIVQYSTPNAALYASIAAFLTRVPVRLYCQWGIRYVGFQGWKKRFFKLLEKVVCTLSSHIEPDSNGNLLFSHNENLYKANKSRVIWNGSANGVNLTKFEALHKPKWKKEIRDKYNISAEDFVLGFVGRLTKDKGVNELLAAYRILSEKHGNTKLLIIGSNDNQEGVDKDLITWSLESDRVIYCGYTEEVEKFLAAMDVYILPSYREGFGSGVIEAEAMGIPVIVSDIPGPTDAMERGRTGLVIPKGSVDDLVEAIETFILDPLMLVEMSENGLRFARNNFEQGLLWEYILKDRNDLYGSIISSEKEHSHV